MNSNLFLESACCRGCANSSLLIDLVIDQSDCFWESYFVWIAKKKNPIYTSKVHLFHGITSALGHLEVSILADKGILEVRCF